MGFYHQIDRAFRLKFSHNHHNPIFYDYTHPMDPNIWQFRSGNDDPSISHPFHRDANLYADPLLREARLHDAGADHLRTAMNGEVS